MGAETWLQCALECGGELTVSMSGLRRFSPGSTVGLSWPRQAQYLFHRDSGTRCRDAEQPFLPRVALHAAH
ncbi:TOBE domain-containing protein [Edwardsiella anguillarum]|nr:TOBE domain-containing protein [Edwardsiella anguillarum]